MKTRRMLWIIVVALALAAATVTVGAAGQGSCGSGCNGMKAQESCGAAGGPMAQAAAYQAERPLDRGSVALISRTCPQSGKTMLVLAVRSSGGQPDPAARLTALVDRRPVTLVQAKPGVYRGQVALSRGTHQLVVHVAQGVSESSVGFPLAASASTAPAVGPCANEDCRCGANCQCGADCRCGTGACQCGESCQCGADCKCSAGQCANAACPCGENCACGPNCNCAEGQCTCPAGGQCQCGETCRCGAGGGPVSPQAYSCGCTPDGRPGNCRR